ncbi:MAG: amidase domain-containing protein [Thermovenabulum sp.]|uniref:amidase domain-containing protein n=1 Tax=Thermovenabulum sp. TaxID=3100335 RepID=UPI003C7C535D
MMPSDGEIKKIHEISEQKAIILRGIVLYKTAEVEAAIKGKINRKHFQSYDKKIDYLINAKKLPLSQEKVRWYVDNYLSFIEDKEIRKKAFQYLGYDLATFNEAEILDVNAGYNRAYAKDYAEKYAENPNTAEYPYFVGADCANFISQVLERGGMRQIGNSWHDFNSWFCYTKNEGDLTKISLTWRVAMYFRRHWGNENGIGRNRAFSYIEMTVREALENFDKLYSYLLEGDVIQYGDPKNYGFPYHTQVVHNLGYNPDIKRNDLYMAQHTKNRKNVSLYKYLKAFKDSDVRHVYVYKMKND